MRSEKEIKEKIIDLECRVLQKDYAPMLGEFAGMIGALEWVLSDKKEKKK